MVLVGVALSDHETKGAIMAIARTVRPTVLVYGEVERIRDLKTKADQRLYGREVTLRQESGAGIAVTFYEDDYSSVPDVAQAVIFEASVEESRDFGASLRFERPADAVLDRIGIGRTPVSAKG